MKLNLSLLCDKLNAISCYKNTTFSNNVNRIYTKTHIFIYGISFTINILLRAVGSMFAINSPQLANRQ